MNKRPIVLRLVIALVVLVVFGASMYPLAPRDFYQTLKSTAKNPGDPVLEEVIVEAQNRQKKDASLYPSQAILDAAANKGVDLTPLIKGKDLQDNRDVISLVRKKSSSSIRFGLDLNGGVEFLLELIPETREVYDKDGNKTKIDAAERFDYYRDQAIETLRTRMEGQKIFESEISPAGGRFISLRVPVVTKDEKLKLRDLIKMSAKLRFYLVPEENGKWVEDYLKDPKNFTMPLGYTLMSADSTSQNGKMEKDYVFLNLKNYVMDGKGVAEAQPQVDQYGQRLISLRFNTKGAEEFARITSENLHRRLAIVLDGKFYCAPTIQSAITGGNAQITGRFSMEEIQNISNALNSGSLPLQIRIDGMFDTDPTLGADNVRQGIFSGAIALVLVAVFMLIYYRLAGVVAIIAVGCNFIILVGAMAAFDSTLTLPGIGGIILTIGMSIDANVLIYERIREEIKAGRNIMNAIDIGYSRAFTVILDSNLTTFFVGLILMYFGSGAVKGFAVTLCLGIVASMFTALFLTRLIFDIMDRIKPLKRLTMMEFFADSNFKFIEYRKVVFIVTGTLIAASVVVALVRGNSVFSIDFTGGQQITFDYKTMVPQKDIESALNQAGYQQTRIAYKSTTGGSDKKLEIVVPAPGEAVENSDAAADSARLMQVLTSKFPQAGFSGAQESSVGGLVGWQFTKMALIACTIAFLGIMFYVALRFEFNYGFAAVLGLLHDVIISIGIYLVCGRQISLPVVASILTIIGYSINNTIVIFDRIREDVNNGAAPTFWSLINLSINQTLSRNILTSASTLLVLVIMYFFGGVSINDFVFMMAIGIVVGFFSSMYVCTSLIAWWHGNKKIQKA